MRVLFTRRIPYALDRFRELMGPSAWAQVDLRCFDLEEQVIPRDRLLQEVQGCDGLFCLLTDRIDSELLDAAGSSLRVVSTMSVGYNHIDTEACHRRNVRIGYTPGVLDNATAETAVALTFAAKRRVVECVDSARNGTWGVWQPFQYCGTDVSDCTIGIVGLGRIGATYARMMHHGFGCRILYTGPREKPDAARQVGSNVEYEPNLHRLLEQSDIVSLHVPLTASTKHFFNRACFGSMKETAVLVNTSRGDVVDQDALYEALTTKMIAAAGLDVTSPEPLDPAHPLFKLRNCTIFPHIGSATVKTRQAMADIAVENLVAGLKCVPLPHQV